MEKSGEVGRSVIRNPGKGVARQRGKMCVCVCVGMHVQFSKERRLHAGQLYEGQLHEETVLYEHFE